MATISQTTLNGLNIKQLHDLKQQWQRASSGCAEGTQAEHEARVNVAQIDLALAQRKPCEPHM